MLYELDLSGLVLQSTFGPSNLPTGDVVTALDTTDPRVVSRRRLFGLARTSVRL